MILLGIDKKQVSHNSQPTHNWNKPSSQSHRLYIWIGFSVRVGALLCKENDIVQTPQCLSLLINARKTHS